MTKHLLKFFQDHLETPGIVVKTGQSVPSISEKTFGPASDIKGVVHGKTKTGPSGTGRPSSF
jgi:hypothetical protein